MLKEFLGVEATAFRNTELIYSDEIGSWIADMDLRLFLLRVQNISWDGRAPIFSIATP